MKTISLSVSERDYEVSPGSAQRRASDRRAETLREKFDQADEDITAALKLISRAARLVRPVEQIAVVSDEPDNRILECALAASANLIVTGDRHLLRLRRFRDVAIVRLADFLRLFPGDASPADEPRGAVSRRRGGRARSCRRLDRGRRRAEGEPLATETPARGA